MLTPYALSGRHSRAMSWGRPGTWSRQLALAGLRENVSERVPCGSLRTGRGSSNVISFAILSPRHSLNHKG